MLKFYGKNTITLIKPKNLRYWLKSIALRDADDVFDEMIKLVFNMRNPQNTYKEPKEFDITRKSYQLEFFNFIEEKSLYFLHIFQKVLIFKIYPIQFKVKIK